MNKVEILAGKVFIRVIKGEAYSSLANEYGISKSRIAQICRQPWLTIVEYCLSKKILTPKGRDVASWRKNKDFFLQYFDLSWSIESGSKVKRKAKPFYIVDLKRKSAMLKLHEGDGFIDPVLYDYVWRTNYSV